MLILPVTLLECVRVRLCYEGTVEYVQCTTAHVWCYARAMVASVSTHAARRRPVIEIGGLNGGQTRGVIRDTFKDCTHAYHNMENPTLSNCSLGLDES